MKVAIFFFICTLILFILVLIKFLVYPYFIGKQLLQTHQQQWDIEKAKYDSFDEQLDAYMRFIKYDIEPHPLVGRCFPRF